MAHVHHHLGGIRSRNQIRRAEQVEEMPIREPATTLYDLVPQHRDVCCRATERGQAELERHESHGTRISGLTGRAGCAPGPADNLARH